jgi:hypothetical protein
MAIWGGNGQFDESSNYIMGWFDYLWLNSSPLINYTHLV